MTGELVEPDKGDQEGVSDSAMDSQSPPPPPPSDAPQEDQGSEGGANQGSAKKNKRDERWNISSILNILSLIPPIPLYHIITSHHITFDASLLFTPLLITISLSDYF